MDKIEQVIQELLEEVITLQAEMEKLSTLVALLAVSQDQPQFQQRPQHQQQQQSQQQALWQSTHQNCSRRTQFDLIPMHYAELLAALFEKNPFQTKAPPPMPKKLPAWFRADLSCAFHQGAPGHDTKQCFSLKNEVQKLIEVNILSSKD